MADDENIRVEDVFGSVQKELNHIKLNFLCKTENKYVLTDLSKTFEELQSRSVNIIKAKFGLIRERHEHELTLIFPILERTMNRANASIFRRLSERMSKCHPWKIVFDVSLPREAFFLLKNNILGITSYGLEIQEDPKCVKLIFKNLTRFVRMFNKFKECTGFEKNVKHGNGVVRLIVNEQKTGVVTYKLKDELMQFNLHYVYINKYGITQR